MPVKADRKFCKFDGTGGGTRTCKGLLQWDFKSGKQNKQLRPLGYIMQKQNPGRYLMAADVGTQSAKVVIFDLEGSIVCQAGQKLRKMDIPAPLLAEHPDDDVWDALASACGAVMTEFKETLQKDPKDIMAVGLCVIRCCRALLKPDGTLAWPLIDWMDKRMNDPYQHLPQYGDVAWVTTSSGYITHRLTGKPKDTCANYIGWWPMDDETCQWKKDPKAFEECNLTSDMLFDVVHPGDILGNVSATAGEKTGLPKGLPVVATAHDKAVEALGAGTLDKGTVLISLGTYICAMVHGREYRPDAQNFWTFQASIPEKYLYECMGVRRGMWTVSWFCDQFGRSIVGEAKAQNVSIEEMFNREAGLVPAGCDGLLTIHDWAPPAHAVYRKGVMLGFDGRHTRAHIYRSILEGIAFTMKNHVDKMMAELETPIERLVITGGGSNSDLIMQIFADMFGVHAGRNQMKGAAAIGCAVNAGMATGAFASYEQAVEKMVKKGSVFIPDAKNHALYDRLNKSVYQKAHTCLDPLLKSLSPIVD